MELVSKKWDMRVNWWIKEVSSFDSWRLQPEISLFFCQYKKLIDWLIERWNKNDTELSEHTEENGGQPNAGWTVNSRPYVSKSNEISHT